MDKPKLSQRLATLGVAAFTTAGSMLIAPSISAQIIAEDCFFGPNPVGDNPICDFNTSLEAGDKIVDFTDFPASSDTLNGIDVFGNPVSGIVDFEDFAFDPPGPLGDEFIFDVVFESIDPSDNTTVGEGITNGTDTISYTIDITNPDFSFSLVSLDSSTAGIGTTVEKQIFDEEGGNLIDTLISTDGSPDSTTIGGNLQSLFIVDTYNVLDGAVLLEFDNAFEQVGQQVPEPVTSIFGLIAVGSLGLRLNCKKQS